MQIGATLSACIGAIAVESSGETRTRVRQDDRRVEAKSGRLAVGDGELTARVANERRRGLQTENADGRTERRHGSSPT